MADLQHILDEVDEALHDEEDEVPTQIASYDDEPPEEEELLEEVAVPAALEELEQKKRYGSDDEGEEAAHDLLDDDDDDDALERPENESHYYVKLKRMWQQELACPELLPLDEATVDEVREELERREEVIDEMGEQSGDIEALLGSVLKVDSDRAKFMLSDLLRTRLWKIQEHPLHMRDLVDRMSESEIEFLKGYGQLIESHLRRTVLDHVSKDALKNLDEPDMIDTPDLEQYVFVKVKETSEIDLGTDDEPMVQQHEAGTTLITRYNVIRELFGQGKVELIL